MGVAALDAGKVVAITLGFADRQVADDLPPGVGGANGVQFRAGPGTALAAGEGGVDHQQVALRAARLASDLDISAIHLVVNRVRDTDDFERTMARLEAEGGFLFTSTHWLPLDELIAQVEPSVGPLVERAPTFFDRKLDGLLDALVATEEAVLQCAS